MEIQIKREYNYSDVFLVPNKCIVGSRSECDTSVIFGGRKFDLPIVPANMPSVIDENLCEYLCERNIFYVLHRFGTNNLEFIDRMHTKGHIASISIGVNEESYVQLKEIKEAKLYPEYILIDIAYAFSPKMEKMLKYTKDIFPESFVWVGNVTTAEGVDALTNWGADAAKLFVGPGAACSTKVFTGFSRPCVSTILECAEMSKIPLIPDGGIREIGDISKALCAAGGGTMVMSGSLLSGFDENPGVVMESSGKKYKEYYGNASPFIIDKNNKNKNKHIEGKKIQIEYKGSMDLFLKHIKESLQSAISYAGGTNLDALAKCKIVAIN
jgi:GMP reductase